MRHFFLLILDLFFLLSCIDKLICVYLFSCHMHENWHWKTTKCLYIYNFILFFPRFQNQFYVFIEHEFRSIILTNHLIWCNQITMFIRLDTQYIYIEKKSHCMSSPYRKIISCVVQQIHWSTRKLNQWLQIICAAFENTCNFPIQNKISSFFLDSFISMQLMRLSSRETIFNFQESICFQFLNTQVKIKYFVANNAFVTEMTEISDELNASITLRLGRFYIAKVVQNADGKIHHSVRTIHGTFFLCMVSLGCFEFVFLIQRTIFECFFVILIFFYFVFWNFFMNFEFIELFVSFVKALPMSSITWALNVNLIFE